MLLRGFARPFESELIAALRDIVAQAPFRHMVTPGGHQMSVAMTNCGELGWVTDRTGYRYDGERSRNRKAVAGDAGRRFASSPAQAAAQAGFAEFSPDACLINRYEPGARMSLHQDKDEHDFGAPIVSVSLGLPAIFLFGGLKRSDKPRRFRLRAWRRRGVGRTGAAGFSRRRAARRRRARADRPPAHQPDVSQGGLEAAYFLTASRGDRETVAGWREFLSRARGTG